MYAVDHGCYPLDTRRVQLYTEQDFQFDDDGGSGTGGLIDEGYFSDVDSTGIPGLFEVTPSAGGVASGGLLDPPASISWILRDNYGRPITYDLMESEGYVGASKFRVWLEDDTHSTDAVRMGLLVGGAPLSSADFSALIGVGRMHGAGWRSAGNLVYWNAGNTGVGGAVGSAVSPYRAVVAQFPYARAASGYFRTYTTQASLEDQDNETPSAWNASSAVTHLQASGDAMWASAVLLKEGVCAGGLPQRFRVRSDIELMKAGE